MGQKRIEAEEINFYGNEPKAMPLPSIIHEDGEPNAAILSERPDGKLMGYLFVFHPTEPVATIYRIKPGMIAGITESGGILVFDDENKDFPMEKIGSISPSYRPTTLTIRSEARTLEVRFTISAPEEK